MRIFLIGFGVIFTLVICWSLINFVGAPGAGEGMMPIGPDTTVVDGPLNSEGDVDYVAYLNEKHGKGITADENAAIDLLKIVGPDDLKTELRNDFLAELGVSSMPENAEYFMEFKKFYEMKEGDEIDEVRRTALLLQIDFSMNPWTAEHAPDLAACMEHNESFLETIHRAVEKPYYFVPMENDGPRTSLIFAPVPMFQVIRGFTRTLRERAMMHLGEGDINACFADTLAIRKLSRLIAQGPALLDQLSATAIDQVASNAEAVAVKSGLATKAELQKYRDLIAALPPLNYSRDRLSTTERMAFVNQVIGVAHDPSSINQLYGDGGESDSIIKSLHNSIRRNSTDWGEAARVGNQWYDKYVEAYDAGSFTDQNNAFIQLEMELKEEANSIGVGTKVVAMLGGRKLKGRLIGLQMASLFLPEDSIYLHRETRAEASRRMVEISMTLEMYKIDHGSYPETLSALAPEYMEEIPLDPFSSKPFPYTRTGDAFALYSTGVNARDDGGIAVDEDDMDRTLSDADDYELLRRKIETWEQFADRVLNVARSNGDEVLLKTIGELMDAKK